MVGLEVLHERYHQTRRQRMGLLAQMQVRGDIPRLWKKSHLIFDGSTDCGKLVLVAFPLLEGQVVAFLV